MTCRDLKSSEKLIKVFPKNLKVIPKSLLTHDRPAVRVLARNRVFCTGGSAPTYLVPARPFMFGRHHRHRHRHTPAAKIPSKAETYRDIKNVQVMTLVQESLCSSPQYHTAQNWTMAGSQRFFLALLSCTFAAAPDLDAPPAMLRRPGSRGTDRGRVSAGAFFLPSSHAGSGRGPEEHATGRVASARCRVALL